MEDQYGMADLRQYINGKPFFPAISRPPDLLSCHRGLTSPHPYDMLVFRADSTTITPTGNNIGAGTSSIPAAGGGFSGFEVEPGGLIGGGGGGDVCTARWPRQETLTLLEIRSRLDPKFKEANQKGPLWDEVSRIMSEEHGYQRSGKKCREKFENLYKYYKKTKEGKAGRQDGKHYRFFRQLEALYGETSNSASVAETHFNGDSCFQYNFSNNNISLANNHQEAYPGPKLLDTSLTSLPNSSDYGTTSSDCSDSNVGIDADDARDKKRRGKRSLKAKIKDSIDSQMRKLMEKQEAWMEKMMTIIEHKEQERMLREEQWRKQDAARIDREHKLWASERAWIEARDIALMDAFQRLTGKELRMSAPEELIIRNLSENRNDEGGDIWPESQITRLMQLRNGMDLRFQEGDISEEALWDEIATKMACYGHERSGSMCKEKWDSVNDYILKCNKKRKENSKICTVYQNHEANSDQGAAGIDHAVVRLNDHGNSPRNTNAGDPINDSCFRYFIGDSYGRL